MKRMTTLAAVAGLLTLVAPGLSRSAEAHGCYQRADTIDCFKAYSSALRQPQHQTMLEAIGAKILRRLKRSSTSRVRITATGWGITGYGGNTALTTQRRADAAIAVLRDYLQRNGYSAGTRLAFATATSFTKRTSKNTVAGNWVLRKVVITWTEHRLEPKPKPRPKKKRKRKSKRNPALKFNERLVKSSSTPEVFLPRGMPAVRVPKLSKSCEDHRDRLLAAWKLAHHHVWRAHQVMQWLVNHPKYRARAWRYGAARTSDARGVDGFCTGRRATCRNTSPRTWFGPYHPKRFDLVVQAIADMHNRRFRGKTFRLVCRTGSHGASHFVYGRVVVYEGTISSDLGLLSLYLVHELYHHLRLKNGLTVVDTHFVCQKRKGSNCRVGRAYEEQKSLALSYGPRSSHFWKAIRNNDNHAYFISNLGLAILGRYLKRDYSITRTKQASFPTAGFSF